MLARIERSSFRPLARFVLLYAAMYGAYGVASPFLPAFILERGVPAAQLGVVLAAGTMVRLVAAPAAGRLADHLRNLRAVLFVCIALGFATTLGYLQARAFAAFLAVSMLQAAALAPTTVLADALAVHAARGRFEYGWVRGTGSAAFIAGTLSAGAVVAWLGLGAIVWMQAWLLACAALVALLVPEIPHAPRAPHRRTASLAQLFRIPAYRRLVLVAALVLGSHAMHDAFAMIRWREAGIGAATAGLLWSAAVAAEVVVFFSAGPALLRRLGPARALGLAAAAGVLRWTVMASTANLAALALVQPLHGFTFALLHLACMRLIASHVPESAAATAQALYGTGAGCATAFLTAASGALFARYGAASFWTMAVLCATALPLGLSLKVSAKGL